MYSPRRLFFLLLLSIIATIGTSAQWNSMLTINSFPSPYFNDWERDLSIGSLTVMYSGSLPVDITFFVRVTHPSYGTIFTARSSPVQMIVPMQVFTTNEILNWQDVNYNTALEQRIIRSGRFPEGDYSICIKVLPPGARDTDPPLTETCGSFSIMYPNPPQLISPANSSSVTETYPVFQWTPVITPPAFSLRYKIKIVEKLEGQTVARALEANRPHHIDSVVGTNVYVYPPDALPFINGREYVWQITATDDRGFAPTSNNGQSEIWSFTYGTPTTTTTSTSIPDTLTLVEGFAFITNLRSVGVTEDPFSYTLNGTATLVLRFPGIAARSVSVSLVNLMLQKGSYTPPTFLSGFIQGNISSSDLPLSFIGNYFRPSTIEYSPLSSLSIGGELVIPQLGVSIPFPERVRLTSLGLSGLSTIVRNAASPLFELGEGITKLKITTARIQFSEPQIRLGGILELFGSESPCTINELLLSADGTINGELSCDELISIPLGSDKFRLNIATLHGNVSFNLTSGNSNFEITAAGGLDFQPDADTRIGADVVVQIQPSGINVLEFTPRGDLTATPLNLGWVALKFSSLNLSSLSYNGSTWNYDLGLDVEISFPTFNNITLPQLRGVRFNPSGFQFPEMNFSSLSLPRYNFNQFNLEFLSARLPAFTFPWLSWTSSSPSGFNFDFSLKLRLPNLPTGTAAQLTDPDILVNASFRDGIFTASLVPKSFAEPGVVLPVGGDVIMRVLELSGSLAATVRGSSMDISPDIRVRGKIELPALGSCSTGNQSINLPAALQLDGNGKLSGTVENIVPPCPFQFGILTLNVINSSLTFSFASDSQKVQLDGNANLSLENPMGTPITAAVTISYEFIHNRLLTLDGTVSTPFAMKFPPTTPALSFNIGNARITTQSLILNGRHSLALPGGSTIGVTFDNVEIDWRNLAFRSGRVLFDTPFAFKVGIDGGDLNFQAVPRGSDLPEPIGLILNLPDTISISNNGFNAKGQATVRLKYEGRDLSSLNAVYSPNFSLSLNPFRVASGSIELFYGSNRIALINEHGFFPDLSYFGIALLPERLGLPTEQIAYLVLKSGDSLLIDHTVNSDGIRLQTRPGRPIRLVIPALQCGRPTPPELTVSFDITIDAISRSLKSGGIHVNIPTDRLADFDLSRFGIPFSINNLMYGELDGINAFQFTGNIKLFQHTISNDSIRLKLMPDGRLIGAVDLTVNKNIPLVPESDKLNLTLSRVAGEFEAQLVPFNIAFNFTASGGIRLNLGDGRSYGAAASFAISQSGIEVREFIPDSLTTPPRLSMGWLNLGLSDFTLPQLSYNQNTGWEFRIGLGMEFQFPDLNVKLPKVSGIEIRRTGIHIPEISIPEMNDSVRTFMGFGIKPLAFRMRPLTFNWFTMSTEGTMNDWGFAFDFELSFPQMPESFPPQLRNPRVTILNAGYQAGRITGTIEPKVFDGQGLQMPLGGTLGFFVKEIGGNLSSVNGQQNFNVTLRGNIQLPDFMSCGSGSTVANTMSTVFTIDSRGRLSGTINGFIPPCPFNLGIGTLRVTTSTVTLAFNEDRQSAIIDVAGTLAIPNPGADSVRATGNLSFDLISGEILNGQIAINSPFRWNLPAANPILSFTINTAVLNREGLRFSGSSTLNLSGGGSANVRFDDFLINYRDFRVLSGSATFTSDFALKFVVETGGLSWSAVQTTAPVNEQTAVRLSLPSDVSLTSEGLRVRGTSTVFVRFNGTDYDTIRCVFSDSFAINTSSFRVTAGSADFYLSDRFVARLDRNGFQPGDLFGIIPIPDKLPLPDTTIAFLQLKSGNTVLVETEPVTGGIRISTRTGQPIQLVVPALQYGRPTPPTFGVSFSVTVNTSTFQLVDGSISVTPPSGSDTLFSLAALGIPLDITQLRYANLDGTYKLIAGGRITLPEALSSAVINIDSLIIAQNGISGNVRIGRFTPTHQSTESYIVNVALGTMARLKISGVEATFGEGSPSVRLSGDLTTELFRSQTGDTAAIHYTAQWSDNRFGFTFDVSHLPNAQLPLLFANFKPEAIGTNPPFDIVFDRNDIRLTLSGTLRFPDFGDEFAVSFSGLSISKNNITLPEISITAPSSIQQFNLFGAVFSIKDLTSPPARAITFSYNDRILSLILSGEIRFLDNTSQFRGFRISSNGTIGLASASLLSREFYIVENHLAVDTLNIVSNNLRVAGFVKLPEPFDTTRQRYYFQIAPNGTISGGANITLFDETPGLGEGDRTEIPLWIATFDPTYASLSFNATSLRQSSLKLIADVYFMNNPNKWIRIGNKSGGTVNPGCEIQFDGTIRWGNIQVAPDLLNINWEALKMNFSSFNIQTSSAVTFAFSGTVSLNADAVSGSLTFNNLKVTSRGRVENLGSAISGGSLSVMDVVSISIDSIVYINTPTTIYIKGGSMPSGSSSARADSQQVTVLSYFRFSASLTINNLGSGGIQELLAYRTETSTNIIIRNANFSVQNVVSFRVDMNYSRDASGYKFLVGGKGTINNTYEVIVVGKIAKSGSQTSAGLFVGATVSIPIPPAIVLTQLGGGFFINPENSDLILVRSLAGLDDSTTSRMTVTPGRFAVLLYAGATIVSDNLISGRVLLTVTENYFALYGKVILLNQSTYLNGNIYLLVGFSNGFAEGSISVTLRVSELLNGRATVGFYVYSRDAWGIYGSIDTLSILRILEARGEFFIGNRGFYMSALISKKFDIWIIKVDAGFEGSIWYIQHVSWGAYCKAWIEASVLGGVVGAKGWLEGALFGEPRFFIYGVAGLKVRALFVSWSGSVWAKIYNGGVDGGFGRDPEMERLIQEAKNAADEMKNACDEAKNEMNNARTAALAISQEELQRAFASLFSLGQLTRSDNSIVRMMGYFLVGALFDEDTRGMTEAEKQPISWVVNNILLSTDAPSPALRDTLRAKRNRIDEFIQSSNADKNQIAERLSRVTANVTELTSRDYVLAGNPISSAILGPPNTTIYVDANGQTQKQVTSQPDFTFNEGIAQQNSTTLTQAQQDFNTVENTVREQITAIQNGIQSLNQALQGSDSEVSTNQIGHSFLVLVRQLEEFYRDNSGYFIQEKNFATSKRSLLIAQQNAIRSSIIAKTNRLDEAGLRSVTRRRLELILTFANTSNTDGSTQQNVISQRLSEFDNMWQSLTLAEKKAQCTEKGMNLWYDLHIAGLNYLDSVAQVTIAMNSQKLTNELENNIYSSHRTYTEILDQLYYYRTALTENLYDIYDRYGYWKQDKPDSIKQRPVSLNQINLQKTILKRRLEVPRVTTINVSTTNRNYYSTATVNWYAQHTEGINEYAIILDLGNSTSLRGSGFMSVGMRTSMTRYFLQRGNELSTPRSVFVRARGGAGYTHQRFSNFTTYFASGGGGVGTTATASMTGDVTPPTRPSVTFPRYKYLPQGITGGPAPNAKFYTSDKHQIIVSWISNDNESGITEYQYAVGRVPSVPSPIPDTSIVGWTSAGGRKEVVIIGLNLQHGREYLVHVRAKNGVDLWSTVGSSLPLYVDTTKPTTPQQNIQLAAVAAMSPVFTTSVNVVPPVPLPDALRPASTSVGTSVSMYSSLEGSTSSISLLPMGTTTSTTLTLAGSGTPPTLTVRWLPSSDPQSGIYTYEYKVIRIADTVRGSSDWIPVGNTLQTTISGAPLSYLDSFYVDVRAVNHAGIPSNPVRLGRFIPRDPTPPSKPTVALSYGIPAGTTYLIFSEQSTDNETSIKGYQIAIGTTPGATNIKQWNDSIDFRPQDIRTAQSYRLPNYNLPDGVYYISVRARNFDGLTSQPCVTGPYYIDSSPPIMPTITPVYQVTGSTARIQLNFSNISDPQSGIARIEYAMGNAQGNTSYRSWTQVLSTLATANPPAIVLSNTENIPNRTYYIGVRTYNTVGLVSQEFWTSITIPLQLQTNVTTPVPLNIIR